MISSETYSQQIQYWYDSFKFCFVNIGLKLGYSENELGDIISKFFLELLEKNIDPTTIDNPQAYLSTAFRRKLTDHYRSTRKNRFVDVDNIPEEYIEPSVQDILEQAQSNTELIGRIRRAYEKLPKRCQKVIYLKFYEGLSTEQILEKTGLSKRSVYNNLFEGIKILRVELSEKQADVKFAALLSLLGLAIAATFFKV